MSERTEFSDSDFEVLDQAMHRLHRVRDYTVPNGMHYFGVPSENDNARNSLADITNQARDYTDEGSVEAFRPRLAKDSRNRILFLLKESDDHINRANREAGISVRVPRLYEKMQEIFDKMGFKQPIVEVTTPSEQAAEELRRFRQYYDPQEDAMLFRDNSTQTAEIVVAGPHDGQHLQLPFPLDAVEFTEARLRKMLVEKRPELFIDFTLSQNAIVAAVSKVSPDDAEIVKRTLKRRQRTIEVEWGDKVTQNPVNDVLGVKWEWEDWGKLSMEGRQYLNNLWDEIRNKVAATRIAYDSADDMIASLGKRDMQQMFIETTLKSSALQPGPIPPGMKPKDDSLPGMGGGGG